jgi:cysteine synthase A
MSFDVEILEETQIRSALARLDGLLPLVGCTPLLEIRYRLDGRPHRLFAKYEALHLTGSVKDRMAAFVLRRAYEKGVLAPGDTIVEASSGNAGISFAALGRALGHPVRIYMPDWMSGERAALIRSLGADVVPVSREDGGFLGAIAQAEAFGLDKQGVFLPRQFENSSNALAHERTTGPEIEMQLALRGLSADAFVAGVGTGGTVMGVGRYLRQHGKVRIHPLEPANSPTLRTGHKVGSHRIQGVSDEFIPALVHLDELDRVVDVRDGDAILMAQALGSRLGLGVGISSGANVLGAMQLVEELGDEATVVTLLPDSNKKYLNTDLCHEEPALARDLTPRVVLESFAAIPCIR